VVTKKLIERSFITGVVRICLEYGWDEPGAPRSFDKGVAYVKERILSGEGNKLVKHLAGVAEKYHKYKQEKILSLEYIHGVTALLKKYVMLYNLNSPNKDYAFLWNLDSKKTGNLFKKEPELLRALDRMRRFGKTNINYNYLERYGLERLNKDLSSAGYTDAIVYVSKEEHIPDVLREGYTISFRGKTVKTYTYAPIMPLLLVSYVQ